MYRKAFNCSPKMIGECMEPGERLLHVRTSVRPSKIQGLGLFAEEFIPKGTVVWTFTPGFDMRLTDDELRALPVLLQEWLATYLWRSKKSGLWCLSNDNGKYFNHSSTPNVLSAYQVHEPEVLTRA